MVPPGTPSNVFGSSRHRNHGAGTRHKSPIPISLTHNTYSLILVSQTPRSPTYIAYLFNFSRRRHAVACAYLFKFPRRRQAVACAYLFMFPRRRHAVACAYLFMLPRRRQAVACAFLGHLPIGTTCPPQQYPRPATSSNQVRIVGFVDP